MSQVDINENDEHEEEDEEVSTEDLFKYGHIALSAIRFGISITAIGIWGTAGSLPTSVSVALIGLVAFIALSQTIASYSFVRALHMKEIDCEAMRQALVEAIARQERSSTAAGSGASA